MNSGKDEVATALAVKNTIPNVSAGVFRKTALKQALESCGSTLTDFKVAGDWLVYVHLLAAGDIAFHHNALNRHRRHSSSVTLKRFDKAQFDEIVSMQNRVQQLHLVSPQTKQRAMQYSKKLQQMLRD